MRSPSRCLLRLALGATLFLVTGDSRALDPDRARCIEAHEQSQILRRAGRLREARAELSVCSHAACPDAARVPCHRWLGEVDASTPSVVVDARDRRGRPVLDVRVEYDGTLLVQRLDGRAVPVDPGPHLFRFVTPGSPPIEQDVVILEGAKNQRLEVAFGGGEGAALAPSKTAPEPSTSPGPHRVAVREGPNPLVYVFGAIGVAGVATFAILASSGLAMETELRDSGCAPHCSKDEISDIERRYVMGDIALGVGVLSLGAAAWFLFWGRSRPSAPSRGSTALFSAWQIRPASTGATMDFTTRF
jgi:hypothetical protein